MPNDYILPKDPIHESKGSSKEPFFLPINPVGNKEFSYGLGIILIAILIFWFVSRWFSDYLIHKRRRPGVASRAALSLFFFLILLVGFLVFGFILQLWSQWWFLGPMGLLMAISTIIFLTTVFGSE